MKAKLPLVSVIIPAYNHEDYVQETIQSVLNQSYQNIELCIIDDGSTDDTWQKIQAMHSIAQEKLSNVIIHTKQNGGTCETLNLLIEQSQGKYVYYLASDDNAKEHAIQKAVDFLEVNSDYALCVGDNEFIDFEGKRIYWDEQRKPVYNENEAAYKTFGDYLKKIRSDVDFNSSSFGNYMSLYVGNYIPNGFLIRKSMLDKIGRYTTKAPLEDFWLMLQVAKYAKMKYFDEVWFSYRWHQANTAKNIKKMHVLTQKTLAYEKEIIASAEFNDFKKSLQPVVKTKKIMPFLKLTKEIYLDKAIYRAILFGVTCLKITRVS